MKSPRLLSLTSSVNEENETEPPDLHSASGAITQQSSRIKGLLVGPPIGEASIRFKEKHFPDTSIQQWNSWRWQSTHSITTWQELGRYFRLSQEEMRSATMNKRLPLRITPYYASLVDPEDP